MIIQLGQNDMVASNNTPGKSVAIDESVHTAATMASSISTSSFAGTTATTTSSIVASTKKSVRFSYLSIHSYYVELGGTGIPNCGPSITLGRELESSVTVEVDDYENKKETKTPRRGTELYQLRRRRISALIAAGYSNGQIRACTVACHTIRKQRAKTVKKLKRAEESKLYSQFHKFATGVEETLQQANRRFPIIRRKSKRRTSLQLP